MILITITSSLSLFVWGSSSHLRIFRSYGDVTVTGGGLHILNYAWQSWPLSSEGSLSCHTYCHTGHSFMIISKRIDGLDSVWRPWHSHLLPSVEQWSCHYLFLRLMSVAAENRTPNLPLAGQSKRSNQLCHRRGLSWLSIWKIQDKKFDKIWSRLIYIFFWLRHI